MAEDNGWVSWTKLNLKYYGNGALDVGYKVGERSLQVVGAAADSTPGVGHFKGVYHYLRGHRNEGDESMKAASRTTGVIAGGVGGFALGGPPGAVAGGIAGGAALDGSITKCDRWINGENGSAYGYFRAAEDITDAWSGRKTLSVWEKLGIILIPVFDAFGGYMAGTTIGERLDLNPAKKVDKLAPAPNRLGLDKAGLDNRANQLNPNHVKSGPGRSAGCKNVSQAALDNRANQLNPNNIKTGAGRPAGYSGDMSKTALNNHANQLNPNNDAYCKSRNGNQASESLFVAEE